MTSACPGCGIVLPDVDTPTHAYLGASPACWAAYGELLAREYSDPARMAVHRMTVDAYCAQHPGEPERRTIQSINLHLVGLHLTVERDLQPSFTRRLFAMMTERLADGFEWLQPPNPIGARSVLDPLSATDAESHRRSVEKWARDVWAAWEPHHGAVRAVAESALSLFPPA